MIKDDIGSLKVITELMLKQKQREFDTITIANDVIKDKNAAKAKYYIEEFVNMDIVEPIYKKIGDKSLRAIRYSYKLEIFLKEGGFDAVLEKRQQDKINTDELDVLRKRNLELENEAHEYQIEIRDQEDRIRNFQEHDLKLSIFQKYWWLISLITTIIGWILSRLLSF